VRCPAIAEECVDPGVLHRAWGAVGERARGELPRRWVFPLDYAWRELTDSQDLLRMLIDPSSGYAQAGAAAMGRFTRGLHEAAFESLQRLGRPSVQRERRSTNTTAEGLPTGTYCPVKESRPLSLSALKTAT
jgi:hypothetical protein